MTDQLNALRELADKVEAGTLPETDDAWNAFGLSEDDIQAVALPIAVDSAFRGSLDAAHSLHKAVLGDRYCTTLTQLWIGNDLKPNRASKDWICKIYKWTKESAEVEQPGAARAWLLAIIKAKIAGLEA